MRTPIHVFCFNKSSAVAEMGDRGHNRHGPKRGGGVLCPFRGALGTRLIQCGLRRGLLPYQVASSSQRCSLGFDVSVSRRSRNVVSKRLGFVSVSWKLGKVSVSFSSRTENQNVSVSSRSRAIGSRLQANIHSLLFHCKIARTSF